MKSITLSLTILVLSMAIQAQSDENFSVVGDWELTRVENLDLENRSFQAPPWAGAFFYFREDGRMTIDNKGQLFLTDFEQIGQELLYDGGRFTMDRQFPDYWTYVFIDERNGLNCRLHFVPTDRERRKVTQDQRSVNRYNFPLLINESQLPKEDGAVYKVVEQMPRFPGCEGYDTERQRKTCAQQELLKYIYRNLRYPPEAREHRTEGTVVISFVVNPDGTTSDERIHRDIGDGCAEEVLRVVQLMNIEGIQWIPGQQRGEAVAVHFNLPVKFKLE